MASVKPAAAALAVLVLVCAATTTTATARAYQPEPKFETEDCKTQAKYFKNCLRLGIEHKKCCEARIDGAGRNCYCEVEREAQIQCAPGRSCRGFAGIVKLNKLNLSCLKNLQCKRA